jgi:CRISPR-associated protein Cmr4
MKINSFYSIRCLTNLHVGSGETNLGVVDNQVQKDTNTKLPTIHSSSLKGALKEYFNQYQPETLPIFGDADKPGLWQFLQADLLSRPVRSDKTPYFNATSPQVISQFVNKIQDMNHQPPSELVALSEMGVQKGHPIVFSTDYANAIIEEMDWSARMANEKDRGLYSNLVKDCFGPNLVLINSEDFCEIPLPVIARNHLENGESKNLWYEEIVPYDSRFVSVIIETQELQEEFLKGLNGFVQVGANASIGYGLCKFNPIKL